MTSPPTSSDDEQLYALVRAVMRFARRFRGSLQPLETEFGHGLDALMALSAVCDGAVLTPGELAEHQGLSAPTASRVVARLVEAGLLQRGGDPDDLRRQMLSATPAGFELRERLRGEARALVRERFADLPPHAVRGAVTALEGLEAGLGYRCPLSAGRAAGEGA